MAVITRCLVLVGLCYAFVVSGNSMAFNVHWMSGGTIINHDSTSTQKQSVDIFCYPGSKKSILSLWQTVKFNIKIKTDEFSQYIANTPEEVYKDYTEDSYGWSSVVNPFQKKTHKSLSIDLFNSTCMAINTKQKHSIELNVQRVDIWRVILMSMGIGLIFASRHLSGNPVFFYLCGILIGVTASFMVLVYYISKLLPKKTLAYGLMIGGWTVGVYIFQQMWENIMMIIQTYQTHVFWYTLVVGFISFLVCYRIGPPRNKRSQNLVMWTLQAVGGSCIFFSSDYQEAAAAVVVTSLLIKYFPESITNTVTSYWRRRFPPARRLLSSAEYYEQGARETQHALNNLREYCSSPDCAQWRIMLKLNESKRFASFVEGSSHLSDEEVLDYESYAYSMQRKRNLRQASQSNSARDLQLSEDDSSSANSTNISEDDT